MRRPKFAETYKKIASGGEEAFYRGELADDIVADIEDRGALFMVFYLMVHRIIGSSPNIFVPVKLSSQNVPQICPKFHKSP